MTLNLFLGPYVEFLTPGKYPDCPEDLMEEWDRLLDDHERLEWNFNRGSPPTVTAGGQPMWAWCAVPIAARDNPPRWPMLLRVGDGWARDLFGCEFIQSEAEADPGVFMLNCSGDGTPTTEKVAPQVEREWFASAYAEELLLLGRIFDQAPLLRWGVLAWQSG